GPHLIVMLPPALDEHLCLFQSVKNLALQELVLKLAIEAFAVAIFPRAARLNVKSLDRQSLEPPAHDLGGKFTAVFRANGLGHASMHKTLRQAIEHIFTIELPAHSNRQRLPSVFVQNR